MQKNRRLLRRRVRRGWRLVRREVRLTHRLGMSRQFRRRRAEAASGVAADVVGPRQVGLARRLQAGNPAPGQGIGCRVAIQQVPQEKVGSKRPRQV